VREQIALPLRRSCASMRLHRPGIIIDSRSTVPPLHRRFLHRRLLNRQLNRRARLSVGVACVWVCSTFY
jgi:hypothetical protein